MTQTERRKYLIQILLKEQSKYSAIMVPDDEDEQRQLLRSLMNVRPPYQINEEFIKIQNAYLQELIKEKGTVTIGAAEPFENDLYLWQGDITRLAVDAIVNAANNQMLGCFYPCHGCIDNAIHTFAGVQLRLACADLMREQGCEEPTGGAKITPAFNLPCDNVIHTVGPIVQDQLTEENCHQLESCYHSCLKLADKHRLSSIAFCCISTGEFHFPNRRAAKIAVKTVKDYKSATGSKLKVIFNVFKNEDFKIYQELLGSNRKITG